MRRLTLRQKRALKIIARHGEEAVLKALHPPFIATALPRRRLIVEPLMGDGICLGMTTNDP